MVEAVVSFAVNKLGDALINETIFLLDVRNQVQELRDELKRMQCFLKDADAKQQGDERVRNWVAEIRNVAYDAEDVVDTYMLKSGATPEIVAIPKSGGFRSSIKRMFKNLGHLPKAGERMFKNLGHLPTAGEKIQAIQAKLKAICASTATYGIKDLPDDKPSSYIFPLRNNYLHEQDEDVTGLEEHTETLLNELLRGEQRRCVVSIVGVGGLGKTTLAKKIFKHDNVMRHFDCRAWCSISQQLNMRDVLLELIKKFMNPNKDELSMIKEMNDRNLVEKLSDYLQDKRYFIVVDDLWSFEDWNILKPAFPNGKPGSKILLTTRKKEVASQVDPRGQQLEPRLLNEEESWELLCKKAFLKTTTNSYPAGLEKLGREMVRKCGGLPLAICALGGILSTKREDIKEWKYVHRDVSSNINRYGGVMGILALSYSDLPDQLKPCFLYLGLFPEDYAIPRKKLIRLWIAEGFIVQHTEENAQGTLEEAGKRQYYGELIQRCMIQADKDLDPDQGKTFRMHDLMRDLCLEKGKELNFLDVYNKHIDVRALNSSNSDTSRRLRRYAIYLNDHERYGIDFYFNNSASTLRTLLVQHPLYADVEVPLMKYQHIKLLRVLDLGGVNLVKNKIEIEVIFELIHLRYLEIGGLGGLLSSSVGNLRNLQTLKIRGGDLPETLANLVQLRHIESANKCHISENFQIGNLINLQTLMNVQAGKWIRKGCFGKLSKLQNLSVWDASRSETDVLIHEISNMKSSLPFDDQDQNPIRTLGIQTSARFDSQIFDSLSCWHNLHRLRLFGGLDGLNFQKYPPNLSHLSLDDSYLEKYPPSLKSLELRGKVYSTKGFPQKLTIQGGCRPRSWTQVI